MLDIILEFNFDHGSQRGMTVQGLNVRHDGMDVSFGLRMATGLLQPTVIISSLYSMKMVALLNQIRNVIRSYLDSQDIGGLDRSADHSSSFEFCSFFLRVKDFIIIFLIGPIIRNFLTFKSGEFRPCILRKIFYILTLDLLLFEENTFKGLSMALTDPSLSHWNMAWLECSDMIVISKSSDPGHPVKPIQAVGSPSKCPM